MAAAARRDVGDVPGAEALEQLPERGRLSAGPARRIVGGAVGSCRRIRAPGDRDPAVRLDGFTVTPGCHSEP